MYQSAKELAFKAKNRVVSTIDNCTGAVVATVTGVIILQSGLARADVPAGVLTAITESVTDIGTIGSAILIVVVAVAGFSWLRRPIH